MLNLLLYLWSQPGKVPTIGVVTFNKEQEGLIEEEIARRASIDHNFRSLLEREKERKSGEKEVGFFVKNLESVQGDERDLIIFSTTFAPIEPGNPASMRRYFGPLTHSGGERRLNVAVTRARDGIIVVTSMPLERISDIHTGIEPGQKIKARDYLQAYMMYADAVSNADGDRTQRWLNCAARLSSHERDIGNRSAIREFDSEFEEQVYDRLVDAGWAVDTQVGQNNFKIDLAVRHPDPAKGYLLGIECDGATYHSSRYARDRDRLRQQVLEGQGWRIHRVWSTDWFRNPERELKRVVEAIESAKSYRPTNQTIDGDQSKIKRADGGVHQDSSSQDVSEYILAELSVSTHGLELHTIPRETMASWVTEVVNVESPVHIQEVGRRIANAAGVAKIGARIQETLLEATRYAARSGEIRVQDQFLWRKDMEQPELRDRSNLANSSRKLELIALEEIAIAVHMVVKVAYGIQQRDVPGLAVRLLGFARVTEDMRSRVEWVVDQMIGERRLVVRGSLLEVPDRA
ncbi:MAG: DUF3320 domain-containing protein [Chloroflexi bacterium]|nr:DUF3320 domain-containing protein [Chloroflexota bacterium]